MRTTPSSKAAGAARLAVDMATQNTEDSTATMTVDTMATVRACIGELLVDYVRCVQTRFAVCRSLHLWDRARSASQSPPESGTPHSRRQRAHYIVCGSSLSWKRSADNSTTVVLPVFFHQCE